MERSRVLQSNIVTSSEAADGAGSSCKVMVVLGVFNGSRHLNAQLASLAAQTHPPKRLIVADDCSSDDSFELTRDFAAHAPFEVEVGRNPVNLGYGENFLRAAARATTEYVAFCDQDDVWHPRKLEVALAALRRHDADLCVHRAELIDDQDRPLGAFDQQIRRESIREPLVLHPWRVYYGNTMLFRTDLLNVLPAERRGAHTFELRKGLSHDLWVYFLASAVGRTVLLPERLIRYRQHGANQTPHLRGAFLRRFTAQLGLAGDSAIQREAIAAHRAELLASIDPRLPRYGERAAAAAAYWSRLAGREVTRRRLYEAPSVSARALGWVSLVARNAYAAPRLGGLGAGMGLKDLIAGVGRIRRDPMG